MKEWIEAVSKEIEKAASKGLTNLTISCEADTGYYYPYSGLYHEKMSKKFSFF